MNEAEWDAIARHKVRRSRKKLDELLAELSFVSFLLPACMR